MSQVSVVQHTVNTLWVILVPHLDSMVVATVCCNLMHSVTVFCRVLQCAAVCCSVLQCVAVCSVCSVQHDSDRTSVLQCVVVCCGVLQCVAL